MRVRHTGKDRRAELRVAKESAVQPEKGDTDVFGRRVPVCVLAAAVLVGGTWGGGALQAAQRPQGGPVEARNRFASGVSVWDTVRASSKPMGLASLEATRRWTQVPWGGPAAFKGDAVLTNGRIMAVLRKRSSGLEVYSMGAGSAVCRLRLVVLGRRRNPAVRPRRVALVENTKNAACIEAAFRTKRGTTVTARFRIKRGQVFIETEPGMGTDRLRVDCPGRFAILPDFFADDIVLDAGKLPIDAVEVPSENFILHTTGEGGCLAVCVFENREQDVRIALSGRGEMRKITGSEIRYGRGNKIWVALLEDAGIWHSLSVASSDAGRIIPLDWKMPFPAAWRVDFTRPDDLTDSWEMLLQERTNGNYSRPRWFGSGAASIPANRKKWTTVLGTFLYPCWTDHEGRGYLQPLKKKALSFDGPVVIYPINRFQKTPLSTYTVVDIMRNTLGVGPCTHILDLEGQKQQYKGMATCGARDTLRPIFQKNQQREKSAKVEKTLDDVMVFIRFIRSRIELYVEFGHKMRKYFAQQKRAHPEMRAFLEKMDSIAAELDARFDARKERVKTPEYAQRLVDEFRRNVVAPNPPDAYEKCKELTAALVRIGGSQDELAGECRWVVRTLRQQAGIAMATNPRVAKIAREIRARTQEVLRNPASHEGARH